MKKTIIIPVVVTRTGAMQSADASLLATETKSKKPTADQWDAQLDFFSDDDYRSGYQIVHVTAEIDVEAVFAENNVDGVVTNGNQGE